MIKSLALIASCASLSAFAGANTVKSCHGNEPFWGLEIGAQNIVLQNPFSDDKLTIKKGTPRSAEGHSAEYIALYQGRTKEDPARFLNVIIERQECSDGMSDLIYPYSVNVLSGTTLWKGCCRE